MHVKNFLEERLLDLRLLYLLYTSPDSVGNIPLLFPLLLLLIEKRCEPGTTLLIGDPVTRRVAMLTDWYFVSYITDGFRLLKTPHEIAETIAQKATNTSV